MSETLDEPGNREEPVVELEENHPTSKDLDIGMVQLPLEQELKNILMEELKAIKT
jgi:hypothetical protein